MIYKPVGQDGDATLPDAMNWEGKMTIPKSWYDSPVSRLTEYAVNTSLARAAPDRPIDRRRRTVRAADRYNERHPELNSVLQLNTEEYYLAKYFQALGEGEKIGTVVERGDHLQILQGYPQEGRDRDLQMPRF